MSKDRRRFCLLIIACGLALSVATTAPSVAGANDSLVPLRHHAWGRFRRGSWKKVRVVSQAIGAQGNVVGTTTTESKTTLMDVNDSSYTLHVEVSVKVVGKQFDAQPQIIKRGFCGERIGQTAEVDRIGNTEVVIDGQTIRSEIRRATITDAESRKTVTVYYSDRISPHVLRSKITATDPKGLITTSQTQTDAIAINVPHQVLHEVKRTSRLKTVDTSVDGQRVTVEVHCQDVPGTLVAHTSEERDRQGRVRRRQTLELIDYEIGPDANSATEARRRRIFRRKRG